MSASSGKRTLYGFYTPHQRVVYTGLVVDPLTGELVQPPARTKQEFKDECDINNIVAAFKVTGIVSHISAKAAQGAYVDLPDTLDYQESIELVKRAEASFMSLPSKVRDRFENDPAKFLEFVQDPANGEELYEMGLRKRPHVSQAPAPGGVVAEKTEPPKA